MNQLTRHWKVAPSALAELEKSTPLGTPKNSNIFSTITSLRFITLIICLFSLQVFASSSKGTLPSFKSLEGNWTYSVSWLSEAYGDNNNGDVHINFIKSYPLKNETDCKAITINIVGEELLSGVVRCSNNKYFLCSGHIDECGLPMNIRGNEFNNETELNDTTLMVHPEYKEIRYVLEFNVDKLIYRYQRKNCFISSPHGCLIDAFSWHDIGVYEINKVHNINNKELN